MHDLLACAGLLLAAAITPGPNNLVVLREAGRGGVRGAAGAIGGIVLGGLALLAVVAAGAGTLLSTHATLRVALGAIGAAYMSWLGLRLLGVWAVETLQAKSPLCRSSFPTIRRPMAVPWAKKRRADGPVQRALQPGRTPRPRLPGGTRGVAPTRADALPAGMLGLFGFQFLNPKGWAMVLTIVAAWPVARPSDYLPLALLFIAIPLACLLSWSLAGRLLAAPLAHPRSRRRIDAALGVLLLASAALLLADL